MKLNFHFSVKIFQTCNIFLNPNVLISFRLSKHDCFSFGQVLKPFHVNFVKYEIFSIFGCQKCVSASEKNVLFKMKFFKRLKFFESKLINVFFSAFSTSHNLFSLVKLNVNSQPEKHFYWKWKFLKVEIFFQSEHFNLFSFIFRQVLKPFQGNFFMCEILRIFGCQKCVSASEKHILFKKENF